MVEDFICEYMYEIAIITASKKYLQELPVLQKFPEGLQLLFGVHYLQ